MDTGFTGALILPSARAPRIVQGAIGLAAPLLAAKPKRMTRQDRRAPARVPSTGLA